MVVAVFYERELVDADSDEVIERDFRKVKLLCYDWPIRPQADSASRPCGSE